MNQDQPICPAGDACQSPYCVVHAAPATLTNLGDDDEPDTSQETPDARKLATSAIDENVIDQVLVFIGQQRSRIAELEQALAPEVKKA